MRLFFLCQNKHIHYIKKNMVLFLSDTIEKTHSKWHKIKKNIYIWFYHFIFLENKLSGTFEKNIHI